MALTETHPETINRAAKANQNPRQEKGQALPDTGFAQVTKDVGRSYNIAFNVVRGCIVGAGV